MDNYDPDHAPDPEEWLALEESERIDLVVFFHAEAGQALAEGSDTLHATIHVVVENQAAMGIKPVEEAIARLSRQGLNRHEAIHAVGAVLSEDIYSLLQGGQQHFDKSRYRRRLEKLTAKRWRKGQW